MSDSSFAVEVVDTPERFLALAGEMLARREVENNLLLGIADAIRCGRNYGTGPPFFAVLRRDDEVVGAALSTPPWHLLVSPLGSVDCEAFARWMAAEREVGGIDSLDAVAERFASVYAETRGLTASRTIHHRLFELVRVEWPPLPGGVMRRALPADLDVVRAFYTAFYDEAMPNAPTRLDPAPMIDAGRVHVWDHDGVTSLAVRNREQPNGASIGPVYTPAHARGRGYASALVAALSQAILDDGKRYACLYTDLENPTSNHIYQAVGYRPIADTSLFIFEPRA